MTNESIQARPKMAVDGVEALGRPVRVGPATNGYRGV
jgi:hypothetical protein